jgi:DNA-3-methyladenine glycosylase II
MLNRIDTQADMADALAALQALEPMFAMMLAEAGPPPLRRNPGGFRGLVSIVVGQQISVSAATAIRARVEALLPEMSARAYLATDLEALRACGLSGFKIRTLAGIAAAIETGAIDLAKLGDAPIEQVHAALTALPGIGPWSADIYALFCLGHGDAFAPGDLALQEAVRMGRGMKERPTAKALEATSQFWRPYRGTAARLLWAWYAVAKKRDGIAV